MQRVELSKFNLESIAACADPKGVSATLQTAFSIQPELARQMASSPALARTVVSVMAASPSLAGLIKRYPQASSVLSDLRWTPLPKDAGRDVIKRWGDLEFLRIAARDLSGLDRLEQVGTGLSQLATDVVRAAFDLCEVKNVAVIGMGKLGAAELNYSSDIDIMLVGDPNEEPATRRALEIVRDSFRVDLDLRPEGRSGSLIRTVDSFVKYWDKWAEPWEFQALLKSAPIAGPVELQDQFTSVSSSALWERTWGADELRQLRHLKARSELSISKRGLTERELKLGSGGIRDVEFSVQLLQLVHGKWDPTLRTKSTLESLSVLSQAGYIAFSDGGTLSHNYRFLRTVEHRLQLEHQHQTHTVPADARQLQRLARVLGYSDDPQQSAAQRFKAELRRCQADVRSVYERLWWRPLLDAFSSLETEHSGSVGTSLSPQATATRLAALGFSDAKRTNDALVELTKGLTRSSRLMQQMLPLILGWLADTADPELGLLGLRRLASIPHTADQVVHMCRDSPEAARNLCTVLGSGRALVDSIGLNPDLLSEIKNGLPSNQKSEFGASFGDGLDRANGLVAGLHRSVALHEPDRSGSVLHQFAQRETAATAISEVLRMARARLDGTSEELDLESGSRLTHIAESVLQVALQITPPPVPMAIFSMGSFGGSELSYASDADIILVADTFSGDDTAEVETYATQLLRLLNGATPAERVITVDLKLRPEGTSGPAIRSTDSFHNYFNNWAAVWERQAYLRCRFVAGDEGVARSFEQIVREFVWGSAWTDVHSKEVRRLKARMEKERIPAGENPQFHLKLGPGSLSDVEWTVQLAQLEHAIPNTQTSQALIELVGIGVFTELEAEHLHAAYRFCANARNQLYLLNGRPYDSLPTRNVELARLARSLDRNPSELRDDYRRITRRARKVMDTHFWGNRP